MLGSLSGLPALWTVNWTLVSPGTPRRLLPRILENSSLGRRFVGTEPLVRLARRWTSAVRYGFSVFCAGAPAAARSGRERRPPGGRILRERERQQHGGEGLAVGAVRASRGEISGPRPDRDRRVHRRAAVEHLPARRYARRLVDGPGGIPPVVLRVGEDAGVQHLAAGTRPAPRRARPPAAAPTARILAQGAASARGAAPTMTTSAVSGMPISLRYAGCQVSDRHERRVVTLADRSTRKPPSLVSAELVTGRAG